MHATKNDENIIAEKGRNQMVSRHKRIKYNNGSEGEGREGKKERKKGRKEEEREGERIEKGKNK